MDLMALRRLIMTRDPELPPIYQRVEYIKGNGAQYIQINDRFNTGVQFELICKSDNTSATQVILAHSARGGYWFGTVNGRYGASNATFPNVPLTDKITALITYTNAGIYVNINGEEKNDSYSSGGPRGLTIFGAQGGTNWYYSKAKIFSLKGEGVCNLIPCYRVKDGEIGMYNTVTKEFLTNLGTGSFTKGPNVYDTTTFAPSEEYVDDGLVLWMDGLDKGDVSGAWVDRVAGHIFESVNGFEDGPNYVGLSSASSQYLRNASFVSPDSLSGTIEVVITDYDAKSLIFMPKANVEMAFGITTAGNKVICSTRGNTKTINISFGSKIFSICNESLAIIDGKVATFSSGDAWGSADSNYNYIGRRNSSNNYQATAKIHAIRIYNRFLTQAEMLHNQRIDNKRYNLGLSI